jgi:hypothetical protein
VFSCPVGQWKAVSERSAQYDLVERY